MRKLFLLIAINFVSLWLWSQPYEWISQLNGHEASISFMSVDEEKQLLLSGDKTGKVILWSLEHLSPIQQIHVQQGLITHIDFDADRGWLLISSYDGTIVLWDFIEGEEIRRFENPGIGAYGGLKGNEPTFGVFILGTNDIAFGGYNAKVLKADILTGNVTLLYQDQVGGITSGFWKKEENSLYFSGPQIIYKVQWPSGQVTQSATGNQSLCEIYPMSDNQGVLSWAYNGQVQFWKDGILQRSIKATPNVGSCALAHSDVNNTLITGNIGADVLVWNSQDGEKVQKLDKHLFPVHSMAISDEDASLFTGDKMGTIHYWKYLGDLPTITSNANTIYPSQTNTIQLNTNTVIDIQETINTSDNYANIAIWDHDQMDHDTISLKVNNRWLVKNFPLTKSKKRFSIPLNEGDNLLTLYAHNEGQIPPNTAGVSFDINGEESFVRLYSDMNSSGTIKIIHEPD